MVFVSRTDFVLELKPPPLIDEKLVENCAKIGADDADIAVLTGASPAMIHRRYARLIQHARAERRTLVRKAIWAAAMEGNVPLLVWLGKVDLGWLEANERRSHLEPTGKRKQFDFDALQAEFALLHGGGAVTNGDSTG